jgi:hypothetical protein
MGNPWKWTALGLMVTVGVAATSTLTTAYLHETKLARSADL